MTNEGATLVLNAPLCHPMDFIPKNAYCLDAGWLHSVVEGRSMRNANLQKEEFSYAYVHAVASHAGFFCERRHPDINSVDATIRSDHPLSEESDRFGEIDLQLKATSTHDFKDGTLAFPLEVKNYNELRISRSTPILLLVLILPPNRTDWLNHSEDQLITRKCAYWGNLKGSLASQNAETVTVEISQRNLFSPESIAELMLRSVKVDGSGVGYEV